jgi:N-acetylglucosaminyldiphosphoundecaprenol N-acetyl-beta-D-mannosaminyltransferase
MPETPLLGLLLADMDATAAAAALAARPADAPFEYVMTPNADNFVRISRDPVLRAIYDGALIRLLDSRVVARAARLLGLAPPAVAPGSDLTAELLRNHLIPGERITIIGLRPAYLAPLIAACGLAPPFHHDPPMGLERDPAAMHAAVRFVLTHPARFVFLAVGSPRQEMLADAIRATGRATGLGLCVGASLEFLAGANRRAPRWMQRAGLEWLHRLGSDPKRLARRYLIDNPPIFKLLLRERLARRA